MLSVRSLLTVTGAILAFTILTPPASQAQVFTPFTLTKECSQATQSIPNFCTILRSSFAALNKAKVNYYGPEIGGNGQFVSSTAVIDATTGPRNSTALGHCIVYATAPGGPAGICTFNGGSGRLAGFQAVVRVTVDAKNIWHWVGVQTHTP